jgi:hypothetical protein
MLTAHMDTFQNGAAFPDWGYPLSGTADAAEATHWVHFLKSPINRHPSPFLTQHPLITRTL